jgi:hypothetical protein
MQLGASRSAVSKAAVGNPNANKKLAAAPQGAKKLATQGAAQGAKKPAARPAAQGVKKPAAQPIAQGAKKPAAQPVAQGAKKPAAQPVAQSAKKPAAQPVIKAPTKASTPSRKTGRRSVYTFSRRYAPYGVVADDQLFARSSSSSKYSDAESSYDQQSVSASPVASPPESKTQSPAKSPVHLSEAELVSFAQMLVTNPKAKSAFVSAVNTNPALHNYMAAMDPHISAVDTVTNRDIRQSMSLLSGDPVRQHNVMLAVGQDPELAGFVRKFHTQHSSGSELGRRALSSWSEVHELIGLQKRMEYADLKSRWIAAMQEIESVWA